MLNLVRFPRTNLALFFNGTERRVTIGVGVILISLHKHVFSQEYPVTESCTISVAEYNALKNILQIAQ